MGETDMDQDGQVDMDRKWGQEGKSSTPPLDLSTVPRAR